MNNWKRTARDGAYEVGIIAEILLRLAQNEISGTGGLEGTSIEWLAKRLEEANEMIEVGLNNAPGRSE